VLLCLGCREDHKVLSSPPDGGTGGQAPCIAIEEVDASLFPTSDTFPIVGRTLPRIGHLAGCNEPVVLQDAGMSCSDPSNLSNCFNPFGPDASFPSLKQRLGPCACEVGDAGTK
jgi:hypothetical protein